MRAIYYSTICILAIIQFCQASYEETFPFQKGLRNLLKTEQCDYKCQYCEQATPAICLQCSSASNRSLVGTTCECKESYLEINEPNCAPCPSNCKKCSSLNKCDVCMPNTYTYKGLCYTKCPDNTYLIPSTAICIDYLSYNIVQERDSYSRVVLTFKFNYSLRSTSNPTSLITMKIKEDPDSSIVSIMPLTSSSQSELKFLLLPRVSVTSSNLMIISYNTADLVSQISGAPIIQVDTKNPITIQIGAYLKPSSVSSYDGLKNSSEFLYNKDKVSYDVFYVLRCIAVFIHIFPALQFIMALCYMEVFRTPLFYYILKLIGGFGINQLPDWQLQEGQSATQKFGDDKLPLLYYVIQLATIYIVYSIFKWVYEIYKRSEVDHITRFETVLKVHIWTITILQYIHSILLFYLTYYSIFILMQANFSSPKEIFFFVLAIFVLFYITLYLIVGTYRIAINSFHFFISYVKEIEEQRLTTRFYLFGVGNAKKLIFVIFICALFSVKSIVISSLALAIYFLAFVYTLIYRPYESNSMLIIKIIEELSQVGIFATILAGQIIYDNESFIIQNQDTYYSIDYACLAFIGVFILMNIFKQLTSFKHLIFKNESTKRTITHMHKFDDHYQDPISVNRNQALIDKNSSFMENYNAVNGLSQSKQQLQSSSRKMVQSQRGVNNMDNSQSIQSGQLENQQEKVQIELNNLKSVNQLTNQSQKMSKSINQNLYPMNRESTEEKNKFQKVVEKTKLQNLVANQFQQTQQQNNTNQNYQQNAFTNAYNNNFGKKNNNNMQINPFKKTDNGYMLQYNLRDLYGSSKNQGMLDSKEQNQYNYYSKKKPVPSIGLIKELKKLQRTDEQINNYFNSVQKNTQYAPPYSVNRNPPENFSSIEKNNFQSNQQQQNQANTSYVFVNPYLQNGQKLNNNNLDNISEEDYQKSMNPYNQSDIQSIKQKIGNNQKREINLQNNDQDDINVQEEYNQEEFNKGEEYEEIDQDHFSQSPSRNNQQINNRENREYNKENNQYHGGESINLQDYQGEQKERDLQEYLKQTIKSKTLSQQNDEINSQKQQNSEDNFQVFFHNKLKDNSIQYIQEEPSDQNIPNQQNSQGKVKKTPENINQNSNSYQIPQIDNYLSPEFRQASEQAQQQKVLFKATTKGTQKQPFDSYQQEDEYY